MLTHPTHDRLIALGLTGVAKALEEQRRQPDIAALAFEERIAMIIDREAIDRENKRLTTRRLKAAWRHVLSGGSTAALCRSPLWRDVQSKTTRTIELDASCRAM